MRSSQASSNRGDQLPDGSSCAFTGRPIRAARNSSATRPPAILIRLTLPMALPPKDMAWRGNLLIENNFYHKRRLANHQINRVAVRNCVLRSLEPNILRKLEFIG